MAKNVGKLTDLKAAVGAFDQDKLVGKNTDKAWKLYLQKFENACMFLGIDDKDKTAALLLTAGDSFSILHSTLTVEGTGNNGSTTWSDNKEAINDYFADKKHLTARRWEFLNRKMVEGESTKEFCTRLSQDAADCEWDKMTNQDAIKITVCLRTKMDKLRDEILVNDITYDKMIAKATSLEQAQTEKEFIKQSFASEDALHEDSISRVSRTGSGQYSRQRQRQQAMLANKPNSSYKTDVCGRCNRQLPHNRGDCPAKGKRCDHCGIIGHFKVCCRKREYPSTMVTVFVNDQELQWRCDSGADANIQDISEYEKVKHKVQLEPSAAKLRPFGENSPPLKVLGQYQAHFRANGLQVKDKVYVVSGYNKKSLLSKYTAFDLQILQISQPTCHVEAVNQSSNTVRDYQVKHTQFADMSQYFTPEEIVQQTLNKCQSDQPATTIANLKDKYKEIFTGIGKHKYRQVQLHIDPAVQPVAENHHRTPYAIREPVSELLGILEKNDLVEKVDGPTDWVSNIHVTAKAGFDTSSNVEERIRITLNAGNPNKAIHRTRHLTPTLADLRTKLEGSKIFSKVDMNFGFNQFELAQGSRPITTFHTHDGLRQYKRLCFGLNAAPEIFHEEIHQLTLDIPNVDNVHDDIIVHANTQADHDLAVTRLFQRFQDCGLTLSVKKCQFNLQEIKFFGVIFSEQGMSPDPDKVRAIKEASRPQTKKDVESFLGFVGWNADFIGPSFATVASPLRKCAASKEPFNWTTQCQSAFDQLKEIISSDSVLAPFDPEKRTAVIADAAPKSKDQKGGLGNMLIQYHTDQNRWKAVSVSSRTLTTAEHNYSQIEVESLASVYAVKHNRMYLYGLKHFELWTDHKPLVPLYNKSNKTLPPRIMRHKMFVQGYNYTMVYMPGAGAKNPADYLSRHPIASSLHGTENEHASCTVEADLHAVVRSDLPQAITLEMITSAYKEDPVMQTLLTAVKRGYIKSNEMTVLKPYKDVFVEIGFADELLLKGERLIIPQSLQKAAVQLAHEGHQGMVRTKAYLRSMMWFPGLDKLVEMTIRDCLACQSIKPSKTATAPLQMTELPNHPWEKVAMDFFSISSNTNEHILVVQDRYSRYPVVDFVSTTSAKATIPKLDRIFSDFGVPDQADSDNGTPFQSSEFDEYMKYMGVRHHPITPLWPQANQAETFMKNLKALLQTCSNEKLNYKQEVFKYVRAYRATPHPSTSKTPAELMFNGRPYKTRLPALITAKLPVFDEVVRKRDVEQKQKMKEYADQHRNASSFQPLQLGDAVLVKQEQTSKSKSKYNYDPYRVTAIKGTMITATRGNHTTTRNASFFKRITETAGYTNVSANGQKSTSNLEEDGGKVSDTETSIKSSRHRGKPLWMTSGEYEY